MACVWKEWSRPWKNSASRRTSSNWTLKRGWRSWSNGSAFIAIIAAWRCALQNAQLKISNATLEDLDYRPSRGLKRAQVEQLRASQWIKDHRKCLITGPTGYGQNMGRLRAGAPSLP